MPAVQSVNILEGWRVVGSARRRLRFPAVVLRAAAMQKLNFIVIFQLKHQLQAPKWSVVETIHSESISHGINSTLLGTAP